jgi:prepilin peptidase CpaA
MFAIHAVPSPDELRPRAFSVGLGLLASSAVVASGLVGSRPLPVVGWAAALAFLIVESDVRCRRIANRVTFPALALALAYGFAAHGATGLSDALLGAAAAFGLLLVPYAVGALGAGDVKAAMALGALVGVSTTATALAFALAFGGVIALATVAPSGQAREVLQRWWVSLATSIATRRWVFLAPPAGSAADRGIPFAVALGFGVAAAFVREGVR